MVQHWTDHRIPFAQNENVSRNWLAGPLYNQHGGQHGSHMSKAFLKKTMVEGTTQKGPEVLYSEGVAVHWDCTKTGHQGLSHQAAFLLLHSCPRPGERETGRQGLGNEKERERVTNPLLAWGEGPVVFSAATSLQAHIIQSNLPRVTTPFFTFEDDAFDISPSQGDLGLPPAVATISSPQGCSVGTLFSHKHLQGARVQPSHLVPKGQAQVPRMHEVAER